MTLNVERVTVLVGGAIYDGWEQVQIDYAIKEATRTFQLMTTEQRGTWNFPPGTPIEIFANADLVLNGYVNRYNATGDKHSHRVTISGRSKAQDFVDSGAMHEPGFWEQKTPDQWAQDLDKFGVGVKSAIPLDKVDYWQIYQGETAFSTVERGLRSQAATMMGLADGSIEITNASVATRHAGALMEGVNIEKFTVDLSDEDRHSEHTVKGQSRLGKGKSNLRVRAKARDRVAKRYRPKLLIHEGSTDQKRAQKRADHERDRAAGLSIRATVETQGFRDDGGQLWTPNRLIFVSAPILMHLVQDMLVEKVSLKQDFGSLGSIATLSLVDPRAYAGKQGKTNSDSAWGM